AQPDFVLLVHYVTSSNTQYLAYLLEKIPRIVDTLTPDQQVDLWCSIGHRDTAHLLKKHGFNANTVNSTGQTPLIKLASEKYQHPYYSFASLNIDVADHIMVLLECEADPAKTILINKEEKTAVELTHNPVFKRILENKMKNLLT
ncbi:MAG TPA: hypothetical protein VHA52_13630, partial [Candidatus Babeliaceae bacterium]|nr:hypothetical protein [Candidatus Babeliaceae bacterium]